MKRTVAGLCMAALVGLTGSAHAQQPETSGTGTFTLTGCLDRANDGTYQLKNARPSAPASDSKQSSPGTSTGATGTSGAADAAKSAGNNAASTWILKSTTDLAPHVGHSVQITGRMSSPAGTGGSDTATTSAPTTTATWARMKKPGEDAKSVDVQAVRMISRSCS